MKESTARLSLYRRRILAVRVVSWLVGAHGLFVLATTLRDELAVLRGARISDASVDLPLLIGVGLVYLSVLLARQKRTAWLAAVVVYAFYLGLNSMPFLGATEHGRLTLLELVRSLLLPIFVVVILAASRRYFTVRSDIQAFRASVASAVLVLLAALVYGTAGFMLLDHSDFHQEIGPADALHRTVDQFDITTSHPLQPYTRRAHLFLDSLSFVSTAALVYVAVSFFQPLKARFSDQAANRARLRQLFDEYGAQSEDFFKLWPEDKQHLFAVGGQAALSLRVQSGAALSLGDPSGDPNQFPALLRDFLDSCFHNDWVPVFVHTEERYRGMYEEAGLSLQKIGQEAVLHLDHFAENVAGNKYFRNIGNRYKKLGYGAELLQPPHHPAVIERLKVVSNEWLDKPGRTERGYVMGYFDEAYLQRCDIMVARDAAGTIQAFLNRIPADFDREEATYDMLRYAEGSPGNINDYLLRSFALLLHEAGFKRLNLGLCPLAGLDEGDENKGLIDTVLGFAYANGDRLYSFSGLYRFKAKYEPEWSDRFIVHGGGVRGFTRAMNALLRVMRVKAK